MAALHSRLGYYYYPDDLHYTQAELADWLPVLKSLGARWLTLHASPDRAIPELFLRGLLEADIEPIIHIPCDVGSIDADQISPLLGCYASWGIHYVVIFDRPNLRKKWDSNEWCRTQLVERFVDYILPILEAQQKVGLKPIFPPLEPGGDYWDTAFLQAALSSIIRRGRQPLLQDLIVGIYAWPFDKPLDWGAGGPDCWPEARPYHTPEGCQDQRGLHIFDWYSSAIDLAIHHPLPLLVVAGGALPENSEAGLGMDKHTERNISIARMLEDESIPGNVLNYCFYCLSSVSNAPDRDCSWFRTIEDYRPVVQAMRNFVQLPNMQPYPNQMDKPLQHYVLLPEGMDPEAISNWTVIGDFIQETRPVIGFSSAEAKLAARVTLIGNPHAFADSIEEELNLAGCIVSHLDVDPSINSDFDKSLAFEGELENLPVGEAHG